MDLLKYAKVERERRWLLDGLPPFPDDARQVRIVDRYLHGTRLRLREVTETDGTVVRKLGHKVRLGDDAREVACTSLYLDDAEWAALSALPGDVLTKLRVLVPHGEHTIALDVFEASVRRPVPRRDRRAATFPVGGPDALPGRYRRGPGGHRRRGLHRRSAGPTSAPGLTLSRHREP